MADSTPQISASFGAPIKQYPGQVQVTRAVKVKAPGKHFSGLSFACVALAPDPAPTTA